MYVGVSGGEWWTSSRGGGGVGQEKCDVARGAASLQ